MMRAAVSTGPEFTISYRIDERDRLVAVSDNWEAFAQANDGAAVFAGKVLGRPLWEFIQDGNVGQLYRHLVARARGGRAVEFHYRCDSPTERRVFLMRIEQQRDGGIEFRSRLQSSETRPAVTLLDAQARRNSSTLRVCSWCQRIALGGHEWVEVEAAVERLKLLQAEALPALTHGICPPCLDGMHRLLRESPGLG